MLRSLNGYELPEFEVFLHVRICRFCNANPCPRVGVEKRGRRKQKMEKPIFDLWCSNLCRESYLSFMLKDRGILTDVIRRIQATQPTPSERATRALKRANKHLRRSPRKATQADASAAERTHNPASRAVLKASV